MKKGFYTALGTPLEKDGTFIPESMAAQIEQQIAAGVSGVLVMGSMGIETYLKTSEYPKVAALSAQAVHGRVPTLVGVTDVSIARVKDRIDRIGDIRGIDGVVSTIPYYNALKQEEIYRFYAAIADYAKVPVDLYDLPGVTKVAIQPDTVRRLWKHGNIGGIKSGNIVLHRVLLQAEDHPDGFVQMFSNIDIFDVAYAWGIDHNLDGMFACTPKTASALYDALGRGDKRAAARALDRILALRDLLAGTVSLLDGFSCAMNLLGCRGSFKADFEGSVAEEDRARIAAMMREMGEI